MSGPALQVTFDAADPRALAAFWAEALGYVRQPPPAGFADWDSFLESVGVPAGERDSKDALVDPAGTRPRLFFQRVPEPKAGKNRMHLDVNVGAGVADAGARRDLVRRRAAELITLGASIATESEELGDFWVVLADPEGNEFCLQ